MSLTEKTRQDALALSVQIGFLLSA